MKQFTLNEQEEYIELNKLLKILKIASSGGEANKMIENGEVTINGEIEYRKRAKLRRGVQFEVFNEKIEVI